MQFKDWYNILGWVWMWLAIIIAIIAILDVVYKKEKCKNILSCLALVMLIYTILPGTINNHTVNVLNARMSALNELSNTSGFNNDFVLNNKYFKNMSKLKNKINDAYKKDKTYKENTKYDYVVFTVKNKKVGLGTALKYIATGDLNLVCRVTDISVNADNTKKLTVLGVVGEDNKKFDIDCYTIGDWCFAKENEESKKLKEFKGKYVRAELVINKEMYIGNEYSYYYKIKSITNLDGMLENADGTVSGSAISEEDNKLDLKVISSGAIRNNK